MSLNLIITDAGRAAILNAEKTGTLPLVIDTVAVGSGLWQPTASTTKLKNEIKRLPAVKGGNPAPDVLYAEILDDSSDAYTLGEFGFYWSDGTLLAIYSQSSPIQEKTAEVSLLLSGDIALASLPANSLTFGDTNFRYPPATESTRGVAEVATQDEANAGSDDSRFITAKKLWTLLTAKFARTDIRPVFKKGINTNGQPVRFGGNNVDAIRYDDGTGQPGTFHFLADSENETSEGNAFLKFAGFTLSSGAKVTGTSDSATSTRSDILATSKAVKAAYDRGTGSVANPVDLGAGKDLNTVTTEGVYYQRLGVNAASGKNYPEPMAGTLIVYRGAGVTQLYHSNKSSGRSFIRHMYSNSWSAWRLMLDKNLIQHPSNNLYSTSTSGNFTVKSGITGHVLIALAQSSRAGYGEMGVTTLTVSCNGLWRQATSNCMEYGDRKSSADMSVFLVVPVTSTANCSWTTTGTRENRNLNGIWLGI